MTRQIENPAENLLSIVEKACQVASHETQRKGWSFILNLEQDNDVDILDGIANTIKLIVRTKKAIDSLEEGYDKELFLNPVDRVLAQVRAVHLDGSWMPVTQSFDRNLKTSLQFCANVLKMNLTQKSLDTNQIESWMKEIDALLIDIIESEVPQELKYLFVNHLEKLRRALLNYWLFGIEGVRSQLEESIGAGFLRLPELRTYHSNDLIKKIIALVCNMANAITVGQFVKSLAAGGLSLILPGS
jgi:hypothetical protein